MNKRMRLTKAEAKTFLQGTTSDTTKARQLARSENDRWKELSEVLIEIHRIQARLAALERKGEEHGV